MGKGRFIVQAHITGNALIIRVLHKEEAFTDRQPNHLIHLSPQGVVNSYPELRQERHSHSRPPKAPIYESIFPHSPGLPGHALPFVMN